VRLDDDSSAQKNGQAKRTRSHKCASSKRNNETDRAYLLILEEHYQKIYGESYEEHTAAENNKTTKQEMCFC
jgi:hypothetical protein